MNWKSLFCKNPLNTIFDKSFFQYSVLAFFSIFLFYTLLFPLHFFYLNYKSYEILALFAWIAIYFLTPSKRKLSFLLLLLGSLFIFFWGVVEKDIFFGSDAFLHFRSSKNFVNDPTKLITLHYTKSPLSILFYSFSFWIFGIHAFAIIPVNIIISLFTIKVIYELAKIFQLNDELSQKAALIYFLYPSAMFFSVTPNSEALFILFSLFGFWLFLKGLEHFNNKSPKFYYFFLAAFSMGLANLSRDMILIFLIPTSIYVLIKILILGLSHKTPLKKNSAIFLFVAFLMATGFFAAMSPVIYLNYHFDKRVSIDVYRDKWMYTLTPLDTEKAPYHSLLGQAGSKRHKPMDYDKFKMNVFKILKFQYFNNGSFFIQRNLGERYKKMWAHGSYGIIWSTPKRYGDYRVRHLKNGKIKRNYYPHINKFKVKKINMLSLFSDSSFISLLLLSFIASVHFFRKFKETNIFKEGICLLYFIYSLLAIAHIFYWMEPRYQAPFIPFLCILSVIGIDYLKKDFLQNNFSEN